MIQTNNCLFAALIVSQILLLLQSSEKWIEYCLIELKYEGLVHSFLLIHQSGAYYLIIFYGTSELKNLL